VTSLTAALNLSDLFLYVLSDVLSFV